MKAEGMNMDQKDIMKTNGGELKDLNFSTLGNEFPNLKLVLAFNDYSRNMPSDETNDIILTDFILKATDRVVPSDLGGYYPGRNEIQNQELESLSTLSSQELSDVVEALYAYDVLDLGLSELESLSSQLSYIQIARQVLSTEQSGKYDKMIKSMSSQNPPSRLVLSKMTSMEISRLSLEEIPLITINEIESLLPYQKEALKIRSIELLKEAKLLNSVKLRATDLLSSLNESVSESGLKKQKSWLNFDWLNFKWLKF